MGQTRAAAFALAFAAALCAQRMTTMLPGTVKNFELPNFNENTGAKEWELSAKRRHTRAIPA